MIDGSQLWTGCDRGARNQERDGDDKKIRSLESTLRLAVAGIVWGVVASLLTSRFIASLLFATSPWDVTTYAATTFALVAVALVSGYLPVGRVSRIDPLAALRSQ